MPGSEYGQIPFADDIKELIDELDTAIAGLNTTINSLTGNIDALSVDIAGVHSAMMSEGYNIGSHSAMLWTPITEASNFNWADGGNTATWTGAHWSLNPVIFSSMHNFNISNYDKLFVTWEQPYTSQPDYVSRIYIADGTCYDDKSNDVLICSISDSFYETTEIDISSYTGNKIIYFKFYELDGNHEMTLNIKIFNIRWF